MKNDPKWQCTVCGLIEKGATPPKVCPRCGAKADRFIKIK